MDPVVPGDSGPRGGRLARVRAHPDEQQGDEDNRQGLRAAEARPRPGAGGASTATAGQSAVTTVPSARRKRRAQRRPSRSAIRAATSSEVIAAML